MSFKTVRYAAAVAVALLVGAAQAAPLLPVSGILEDDNKEYVTDSSGALKTSGSLAVGDTLFAVVNFINIRNTDNTLFAALGAGNAIYGVSAITVTSIVGGVATFGANAGFEATYGAGAMAALFTSGTPLDVGCATIATCEADATSGALWMTLGFGEAADFWIAGGVAPFSIGTPLQDIAGLDGATKVAAANYGLSVLTNNTGYTFSDFNCPLCEIVNPGGDGNTQIVGSGDVLGGLGLTGGFIARSDFDFSFQRVVPEPGTVALLGLGMLGLGFTKRRTAAQ